MSPWARPQPAVLRYKMSEYPSTVPSSGYLTSGWARDRDTVFHPAHNTALHL
jgi:hypothetical protein